MVPVVRRISRRAPPVSPAVEAAVEQIAAVARVRRVAPERRQNPSRRADDPATTQVKVIPIAVAAPVAAPPDADDNGPKVDYKGIIAKYMGKVSNRKTAIRAFCVQCCNGGLAEVRLCPVEKCALHPFRLGADPFNLKSIKAAAAKGGNPETDDEEEE